MFDFESLRSVCDLHLCGSYSSVPCSLHRFEIQVQILRSFSVHLFLRLNLILIERYRFGCILLFFAFWNGLILLAERLLVLSFVGSFDLILDFETFGYLLIAVELF